MHRKIVYTGAVPQNTDILDQEIWTMESFGFLLQFMVGMQTSVVGFAPTLSGSALSVSFSAGAIVQAEPIDTTELGTDTLTPNSNTIMKIAHTDNAAVTTFNLTAPTTAGQSINYLVQVAFEEVDDTPVALEYFNSANPNVPIVNSPQNTRRAQIANLNIIQGAAATTGTQLTPAPNSGFSGLYVITVPYGATVGTSCMISQYPNAPFLPNNFTNLRTRLTANTTFYVSPTGSDSNPGSSALPFQTLTGAYNYIQANIDTHGFNVTLQLAAGTYAGGIFLGALVGGGTFQIIGNASSPSSYVISATSSHALSAYTGADIFVTGVTLTATGSLPLEGCGVVANPGAIVTLGNGLVFGACSGAHISASGAGLIQSNVISYSITGGSTNHMVCSNGLITLQTVTVSIPSAVAFSQYFAQSNLIGLLQVGASSTYIGSGVAGTTGAKFYAQQGSIINTSGAGINFFPGDAAGSVATYGQYL